MAGCQRPSAKLVTIVTVIVEGFGMAAIEYFALEEMAWFSPRTGAPLYERGMATVALLVSVAGILLMSMFAYVSSG